MNITTQIYVGVAGMSVLAMFIIVFFLIYQRRLLKEQQKANKLEKEYQKTLISAGIQAQEEERTRIARDLHDSVGGLLSATKMHLQQLDSGQNAQQLSYWRSKALVAIDENISNVREITQNLMPQSLQRLGLVPAVDGLCKQIRGFDLLNIRYESNLERRFAPEREVSVFRILQELTNNTIKHANASEIKIHFHFSDSCLRLTYFDNGKGFEKNNLRAISTESGLGLKNIQSRIDFINGTFDFYTAPGEGVQAIIEVPLESVLNPET